MVNGVGCSLLLLALFASVFEIISELVEWQPLECVLRGGIVGSFRPSSSSLHSMMELVAWLHDYFTAEVF